MKWTGFALLLLLIAAPGVYFWRTAYSGPTVPPERLVEPRKGNIVRGVIAIGRVEPRTRVEVKSKASGIIRRLLVDVADPVRADQVIVELDKEILQARVNQAEGKLEGMRGALEQAKAEIRRIEVETTDPAIAYASRNWERSKKLFGAGLVSEDERDLAQDLFDKAQYRLRVLDAQLVGSRAALATAEGNLREIEAVTDLARQELKEATIVAPIDGVVLHRYLEEGDSVSSIRSAGGNATTIMTLGDLNELYVDGEVDEVDVGKIITEQKIRPDLIARIKISSFPDREFTGQVTRISGLGLEDNNGIVTYEVRIVFENPEKLLLANMTANSQIILEEKTGIMLISQGALSVEGKTRYATIYNPTTGNKRRQEVVAGISDGSQVEVANDLELQPGEKILMP
jgi:HlyD family secretion protein